MKNFASTNLWAFGLSLSWGFLCGIVCSFFFDAPWNRPIHWLNIAWMFVALPAVIATSAFFRESYRFIILNTFGIAILYIAGFWSHDYFSTGLIFDDMLVILLFAVGYSLLACGSRWLVDKVRPVNQEPHAGPRVQLAIRHILITTAIVAASLAIVPLLSTASGLIVLFASWPIAMFALVCYRNITRKELGFATTSLVAVTLMCVMLTSAYCLTLRT